MKRMINPSALAKGAWLERRNDIGRAGRDKYKDHPTDFLLIEEVKGDRVQYARLDGWKNGHPVLGRTGHLNKFGAENRRFKIVPAPTPPGVAEAKPKSKPAATMPPAEVDFMIAAIREEMRDCTHRLCASIDALTAAWTGRRPEASKLNGHALASVTQ